MSFTRRKFITAAAGGLIGLGVLGSGGLLYATRVEPLWIEFTQLSLTLPRLHPTFDGYRLLQFSDIHFDGRFMDREMLLDVIASVRTQQVDAIVYTGDFVTDHVSADIEQILGETFASLYVPDGVFAVMGNHDYWSGVEGLRRALNTAGVIELDNRVHTLRRGVGALHLCGLDDIWERQHRLDHVLAQIPDDGAAILLAHEPDFADTTAATGRFDLQLSGHSHGGQVNIPLIGPPILPWLGRKYHTGLYQIGSLIQYTNRGIGTVQMDWDLPAVRFNCRPEITVITLHSA